MWDCTRLCRGAATRESVPRRRGLQVGRTSHLAGVDLLLPPTSRCCPELPRNRPRGPSRCGQRAAGRRDAHTATCRHGLGGPRTGPAGHRQAGVKWSPELKRSLRGLDTAAGEGRVRGGWGRRAAPERLPAFLSACLMPRGWSADAPQRPASRPSNPRHASSLRRRRRQSWWRCFLRLADAAAAVGAAVGAVGTEVPAAPEAGAPHAGARGAVAMAVLFVGSGGLLLGRGGATRRSLPSPPPLQDPQPSSGPRAGSRRFPNIPKHAVVAVMLLRGGMAGGTAGSR